MKNQVIIAIFFLSIFLSGCSVYTSKTTADICDDACQQERDVYINQVNALLAQAQGITSKVNEWKTVTREDLDLITSFKTQISTLSIPEDFDMVHDYYKRAFNDYVKAIDYVVSANEEYSLASGSLDMQSRNIAMSQVVHNVQEANKLLIYADEEVKFATRLVSKS